MQSSPYWSNSKQLGPRRILHSHWKLLYNKIDILVRWDFFVKAALLSSLFSAQIRERELQDNLALHRQRREVEELGERLTSLMERLGGIDVKQLEKEKRQLKEEQAGLEKKVG